MPKGEHTPISDEEAEEWVRRIVTSAEDLGQLYDADDWESFVTEKLLSETYQTEHSVAQSAMSERGRSFLYGELAEGGFKVEYPIIARPAEAHIRDLTTGRFISWEEVQKAIVPFRPF